MTAKWAARVALAGFVIFLGLSYRSCLLEQRRLNEEVRADEKRRTSSPVGRCEEFLAMHMLEAACACDGQLCQVITRSGWDHSIKAVRSITCTAQRCGLIQ